MGILSVSSLIFRKVSAASTFAVNHSLAAPDVHTRESLLNSSLNGHLKVTAYRLDSILEALSAHRMLHHLHEEPERVFVYLFDRLFVCLLFTPVLKPD